LPVFTWSIGSLERAASWTRKHDMTAANPEPPRWDLIRHGPDAELRLTGDWIACETGVRGITDVQAVLDAADGMSLRVNVTQLGRWDSALIAFLKMLRDATDTHQAIPIQFNQFGLPEPVQRLLALAANGTDEQTKAQLPKASLAERIGLFVLEASFGFATVLRLVGDTVLRSKAGIVRDGHTRSADILQHVRDAGAGALGIVAIVNGLVGAIIAFVGAIQLRRFGAGIYVADLVGIGMARELAAIMTAIVMAGRTGGAYAAQLATMQGSEEIDALRAFGIPVYDFLILPRVVALVAMMPLLYIYGCALGLLGGYVVSVGTLDLTSTAFLEELRTAVAGKQFAIGLIKSVTFGALIALTGCHIGLQAGRSAADVGRAATTAVVIGIIGIIGIDAVFAVCTNALRI
jgi:phospholipid/cholesterol/gamma-HCH transport system permease protein